MVDVREGVRLAVTLPGDVEAYEHDDGAVYLWSPSRKKHVAGLTLASPTDAVAAALTNLGFSAHGFSWEPPTR